jgi:hypothetical protein
MPRVALFFLLGLVWAGSARSQSCLEGRYGPEDTLFAQEQILYGRNFVYGSAKDWLGETRELVLDVYTPDPLLDTLSARPAILMFHGGGFSGGSKTNSDAVFWANEFARRGYVALSATYRTGWPDDLFCAADTTLYLKAVYRAIQDVRAAFRWAVEESIPLGIDTQRIILFGNSAGAAAVMGAVFAREGNFSPDVPEELGMLDQSGNDFNHVFDPAAILGKGGGLGHVSWLQQADVPMMLFHGTCDMITPYDEGPLYHCYAPDRFVYVYGPGKLMPELERLGRCYSLYTNVFKGHVAVENDTLLHYGTRFLQSLLCGECRDEVIERISSENTCENRSDGEAKVELLYPNPNNGVFFAIVSAPGDGQVDVELYDASGRQLMREKRPFIAPVQNLRFDFPVDVPGTYFFRIGLEGRYTITPLVVDPRGL